MRIISPKPYRVFQRGGSAKIRLESETEITSCDISVTDIRSGAPIVSQVHNQVCREGAFYVTQLLVPQGGWYALTVSANGVSASVEPFGVGEVFVIAGQSHATNSNNKQFRVREPEGRITVYEPSGGNWRVAHDRQPCYDSCDYNSRFGSLWPVTFDNLFDKIQLPIGMTNAAYGATALFQWMPGHESGFFDNLLTCCRAAESFRAIMWQQGESDGMWHTETDVYVEGMKKLKRALDDALGFKTKWLVAKSTIHPSVYTDPEHEGKIRAADDILWNTDGFYPGPDTDTLTGDCRDAPQTFSGHMTEKGQLMAGQLWAEVLADFIGKDLKQ